MEPADRIAVMDDLWSLREEPAATLLVPWHGDVIVDGVPARDAPRARRGDRRRVRLIRLNAFTSKGRLTSRMRGS